MMRWLTIFFMISGSNKQLQQHLEYILLKPDCHSWWISKMQSRREEERYAIKFCFKLRKMAQKRMECFRLLFDHLVWIEHQFLSGIRDSRKASSLWKMMRGVGGVGKSIHQSWLAKGWGLGLELLCWGFKGVQEEIPMERGQHSSSRASRHFHKDNAPVLNSIHVTDYLTKMGIKTFSQPPFCSDLAPSDFSLFLKLRGCCHATIELIKEAVTKVIDTLIQEDFHGAIPKLLERYNKCIATGGDLFEGY